MTLIVDASILVKFGVLEDDSDRARMLLLRGNVLIAPDLAVAEVANAFWKKERLGQINPAERSAALAASLGVLNEIVATNELAQRALSLAHLLAHPVYDCFYVALTEARGGTLITANARLLAKLRANDWKGHVEAL
jgi:predicted nucleic acid-binding protein